MLAGIARRVGRRLLASIPALLGVVIVTFILMRVLPGDPATFFASGPGAGQEEIEELRRRMGLDKPLPTQLVRYLDDIARGDLGRSLITGQPVVRLRRRLPASLELTFTALMIALICDPARHFAALRANSIIDHAVRSLLARRMRADLRVGAAADLCLLLSAGLGARPDGRIDIFTSPPPAHRLPADRLCCAGDSDGWCAASGS